ncbi:hypothetical protein PsAD2_03999 [Pseudovibrio axinellae]|uniref:HTH cro/C1-type domain-containing protein n=1 Tax=Pseudovibrio axinellae TaxID=989403 RepID=A0A165U2Z7_9HYPH|nr:helix-turn-helix domain-containing protein [Pseudovibrio axinellae]KZL10340.1 hypothetical protein PsAD2_03999 [Pseudovibrio axinellae]SER81623.1 hypothetical protein SAMN05421798_12711 [Pseudovibrio axinellae]
MNLDPKSIDRTVRVTRYKLGYTPSEMAEVLDNIAPTVNTLAELRTALVAFEKNAQFKLMTAETIRETRILFGFTAAQFGPLLGFKTSATIRSTVSALEGGRIAVSEPVTRLARAYISGYRPPDWPHKS